MRLALAALVMCAGCDDLFNIDHIEQPPIDAAGSSADDAMVDAQEPTSHITFVQGTSLASGVGAALFQAFPNTQKAGDLNVVFIGWTTSGSHVLSVSDTLGNQYAVGASEQYGNVLGQVVYYAQNIRSGSNTVTVRFNQTTSAVDIRMLEYAGVATTNALDANVGSIGSGMLATTGTITTLAPHTIVIAGFMMSGMATGPGNGCTERVYSNDGNVVEDFEKLTPGPSEATAPQNQNGAYIAHAVSFAAP